MWRRSVYACVIVLQTSAPTPLQASEIYVLLNSYNNSYFAKAGMALLVADSLKALTEVRAGVGCVMRGADCV